MNAGPPEGPTLAFSLLRLSAWQRLGLAGVAIALIWLGVFWSLG